MAATGQGAAACWRELKADPGQVGLETLLREIDKLERGQGAGAAAGRVRGLPRSGWWRRGGRGRPGVPVGSARRTPAGAADAVGGVVLDRGTAEITDALVDLLLALMHKINTRAESRSSAN